MNVLFANYGDFSTNSIHHIAGFANQLNSMGADCLVALPSDSSVPDLDAPPRFQYGSYDAVLEDRLSFSDKRPADIVHAWTPRENVRLFVERYLNHSTAKLIVHLEDNEESILESYYRTSIDSLRQKGLPQGFERWEPMLSHPLEYRAFLNQAAGITVIIDALQEFVPPQTRSIELWPGAQLPENIPLRRKEILRARLGIEAADKTIVYTGGVSSSNLGDILTLYQAVGLLNESGHSVKLVKTGPSAQALEEAIPSSARKAVIDLGIVPKRSIPEYLSIADVLVQPGKPDAFNRYRLPSKLPEFLLSGIPVVATKANLYHRAPANTLLPLSDGSPAEIAAQCRRVFESPQLAQELSRNGLAFARSRFSIQDNASRLWKLYEAV